MDNAKSAWMTLQEGNFMKDDVKNLIVTLLDFRHDREAGFLPLMAAIEGLTAEQASWKPNPQSHSIWQLVRHILFWNEYILQTLQGGREPANAIDNDQTFGDSGDPDDEEGWREIVKRVAEVYGSMRHEIIRRESSDLDGSFDEQGTTIQEILADIAMHDAYHIGQIMLIRKLQGWKRANKP